MTWITSAAVVLTNLSASHCGIVCVGGTLYFLFRLRRVLISILLNALEQGQQNLFLASKNAVSREKSRSLRLKSMPNVKLRFLKRLTHNNDVRGASNHSPSNHNLPRSVRNWGKVSSINQSSHKTCKNCVTSSPCSAFRPCLGPIRKAAMEQCKGKTYQINQRLRFEAHCAR